MRGVRGELVGFRAADGVELSGLLFEPSRRPDNAVAVVWLHGNGDSSVFRSRRTNVLAEIFQRNRIAFFPFDNRGAGLMRWLRRKSGTEKQSINGGTAYERIDECVHDIDGALREVRSRGYRAVYLAGHSSGANKIVVFHTHRPRNRVAGYALLAGGDDTGLYRAMWGDARFDRILGRVRTAVEKGKGGDLVPRQWSPFPMSYRSLFDTIDPDGHYNIFPFGEVRSGNRISSRPLFDLFGRIRKRMYVAHAGADEYLGAPASEILEILRRHQHPDARVRYELIPDADHGFAGGLDLLGQGLSDWIHGHPERAAIR